MNIVHLNNKEYIFKYRNYTGFVYKNEGGKKVTYEVPATHCQIMYRNEPGNREEELKLLCEGHAKCSPEDQFNKKLGRKIAFGKAIEAGKAAGVISRSPLDQDSLQAKDLWEAFFFFTPLEKIYKAKYRNQSSTSVESFLTSMFSSLLSDLV